MPTRAALSAVLAAAFFVLYCGVASPASAEQDKVTICHATGSTENPYVKITVNTSAVDGHGKNDHQAHTGSVFDFSDPEANEGWGDIVPPSDGVTAVNWPSGAEIHGHGCNAPEEGTCPDGSQPLEGQCQTEEQCPSGEPAQGGECPEGDECPSGEPVQGGECPEGDECPSGEPVQGGECPEGDECPSGEPVQGGECPEGDECPNGEPVQGDECPDEADLCSFDRTLAADDEGCVEPQGDPEPEPQLVPDPSPVPDPEPCPFDAALDLDDEACVEIGTPAGLVTNVAPEEATPSVAAEPEVLGAVVTPAAAALPTTGLDGRLALVGAGLVAIGAAMVVAQRRLQQLG